MYMGSQAFVPYWTSATRTISRATVDPLLYVVMAIFGGVMLILPIAM